NRRFHASPNLRFFPGLTCSIVAAPSSGPPTKPLFRPSKRLLDPDSPDKIALGFWAHFFGTTNHQAQQLVAFPNLQTFSGRPLRGLHFQPPFLSPALHLPTERL